MEQTVNGRSSRGRDSAPGKPALHFRSLLHDSGGRDQNYISGYVESHPRPRALVSKKTIQHSSTGGLRLLRLRPIGNLNAG